MTYSKMLRELFPEIELQGEDLLLLEAIQVNYLPDRVPQVEFATLLREFPVIHRFLVSKNSSVETFFNKLLKENKPVTESNQIKEQCQEALWEIADLIIYNKHPELLDSQTGIHWNIEDITSVFSLDGKTVADVGAGSGRIAFLIAPYVRDVFAVEPITSFRSYMKDKALKKELNNLYIMDGTLDSIPLPDNSLDVLITSNAIGWNLKEELKEIERVVKPGGSVLHLLFSDEQQENPYHDILTSKPWNYDFTSESTEQRMKIKFYKILPQQ